MKKLLVCLLILVLALAALIAYVRGGASELSPAELSQRGALATLNILAERGWSLPYESQPTAVTVLGWLMLPGLYLFSRLGIWPETPAALLAAGLFGWWLWLTAARTLWCSIGRRFGFLSLAHLHYWYRLWLPWRPVYRQYLKLRAWWSQFSYGKRATASWAGFFASMTLLFRPGDQVFVGRLWGAGIGFNQPIGIAGPKHVTVVAGAGSGKTRWVMGWLGMLHRNASSFVTDCDGQIVNALGSTLERDGHLVINLDPYHLSHFPCASWNAIEEIDAAVKRHGPQAAVRFSATLAEALIREDNANQPIFANSARIIVQGVILYVWLFEPPERRNLLRVRELLTVGLPEHVIDPKQDQIMVLSSFMQQAPALKDDQCEGQITAMIARAGGLLKSGKNRDGGNPFLTTAVAQTSWLDLPEIAAISKRSDFHCEDLKKGNPCVFVCAPVTDLQNKLSGWVRALTMMTMYAFQNIPGRLKIPCAFILDEMPSLGRIEILETAAPVFRKYGIRLVIITQDLERLQQAYPESWGGFIGNSQCTIWMGTDHQPTVAYLSNVLGARTLLQKIEGGNWLMRFLGFSKIPARNQLVVIPLMYEHQVKEFLEVERRQIILTRGGKPPMRLRYEMYDRALPGQRYDADRNFREPLLRNSPARL